MTAKPPISQIGVIYAGLLLNFFSWLGGGFVIYSFVVLWTKQSWPPLEHVAIFFSAFFTVLGTLVTAASIYWFSPTPRKPENYSKFGTAPIVIVFGLIAIYQLCHDGNLPPVMVNGFAILAIAGSLLRLHPRPIED